MVRNLFAVAVLCAVLTGSAAPRSARAGQPTIEDLRSRLARSVQLRGKDLRDLARWCDRTDRPGWAALFRARALRYLPDDEKIRAALGFVREDGAWAWPAPAHDEFRELVYGGLPAQEDVLRKLSAKRRQSAQRFAVIAAMAAKAMPSAKATSSADATGETRAALAELQRAAWERAVEADPTHKRACKALGYVEFDGRPVHPDALPFLEARARRAAEAREILAADIPATTEIEPGTLGRAKSGDVTVDGSWDVEQLARIARAMVRSHRAFVLALRLGDPDEVRKGLRFVAIETTRSGFIESLEHYGGYSRAKAEETADKWGSSWVKRRHVVMWKTDPDNALELAVTFVARGGCRELRKRLLHETSAELRREEDWLYDAVSIDVAIRIAGGYAQSISSDKGTTEMRNLAGGGSWLYRARIQVEFDDDLEMLGLVQRRINSLRLRETAKGYAFLQYLYERDAEKAARFVAAALVRGAVAAAQEVYTERLEDLDAGYRRWALLTLGAGP